MNKLLGSADVGKKNLLFGIALFLLMGLVVGIPLTINFFGGSVLAQDQYQTWKVVHGYAVFLAFINYFFGLIVDRLDLARSEKELSSWSMIAAGVVGGLVRMALAILGAARLFWILASLGEVVFMVVGTAIFVKGQLRSGSAAVGSRPRPGYEPGKTGVAA